VNLDSPFAFVAAIPYFLLPLVLLTGAILAIVLRKRLGAPATALLTLGSLLGVAQFVFGLWLSFWGYEILLDLPSSGDYSDRLQVINIVNGLQGTLELIWVVLVIAGALLGRRLPPQVAPNDPSLLTPRPGESEWTVPSA
jgi:hypothetical protein